MSAELISNMRAVIELSRHCTSPGGGHIPTFAIKEAIDRIAELEGLLQMCADFIEPYSDVSDGAYGEPAPNMAMSLVSMIDEALGKRELSSTDTLRSLFTPFGNKP